MVITDLDTGGQSSFWAWSPKHRSLRAKSTPLPGFVKIYLDVFVHVIVPGCFGASAAELKTCDRHLTGHEAKNTDGPVLCRKCLLPSALRARPVM